MQIFVNQELLLRNEYLAAEHRILSTHLPAAESRRGILPRGAHRFRT
jgi:hypothetical protein